MSAAYISARPSFAGPSYIPEDYPVIRSVADPSIANLPAEDLEAELLRQGIRAEDMESFLSDIGSALSKAAPVVGQVAGKALPGIISGAAAGCALGPWGCLGGALVGGVTSALSGGGSKPGGGAPSSASGVVGTIASAVPAVAGAFGGAGGAASGIASALPAIAGLIGGNSGAKPGAASAGGPPGAAAAAPTNPAGVLLGLVQRPEVIQSLMSMALGSAGRKDIPVGGTNVPVSAFANLIGMLGAKAFGQSEALAEPSESLPPYLYREGKLQADPADPAERAAVLLERLGEVAVPVSRSVARTSFTEADEYYDELDAAELDLMEMEGAGDEFDE